MTEIIRIQSYPIPLPIQHFSWLTIEKDSKKHTSFLESFKNNKPRILEKATNFFVTKFFCVISKTL